MWAVFSGRTLWMAAAAPAAVALNSPKYLALLDTLSQKHQFDRAALRSLFGQVSLKPEIIATFDRPPENLAFHAYRKRFITDALIDRGRAYLAEHQTMLHAVEGDFGVPKEIICGILGVETKFGQPGLEKYRAFDVLNTAFALYARREAFYRDEIVQFLILCREENLDALSVRSSYAGAMGVPQFMPSSARKYAFDYDGDGKRNLWSAHGDIFASVANYLRTFGWEKDGLLSLPARLMRDTPQARAELGARKTMFIADAARRGIDIQSPTPSPLGKQDEVSFAFYEPREGEERLLALFKNFRALISYNASVNYSLTVLDLSARLATPAPT